MSLQTAQSLCRVNGPRVRHFGPWSTLILLPLVLAPAAGCGSDSKGVKLNLTAPTNGQVLTVAEDDVDDERPGLQFDVTGTSRGIAKDTPINLLIDGNEQDATAKVGDGGDIEIAAAT